MFNNLTIEVINFCKIVHFFAGYCRYSFYLPVPLTVLKSLYTPLGLQGLLEGWRFKFGYVEFRHKSTSFSRMYGKFW